MAEDSTTNSPSTNGDTKKKKGGLLTLIKKNKTLSAVVGAGGLYFLWKMRQEPPGEVSAVEETPGGSQEGLLQTGQLEQYETGRAERAEERAEEDTAELEAERTKEREKNKEEKEEREENSPKEREVEPGPISDSPAPKKEEKSLTIHGKTFKGAIASHVAGAGQTTGGKKYVEYAITFPGRVEHWRYFTDSGSWSLAKNSSAAAGGNSGSGKETGSGSKTAGQTGKTTAGNTPPATPSKSKMAVGKAVALTPAPKPVAVNAAGGAPQNNAQHPQAVNTGNKCVNGGIGGHTAPAGYHLFCQGGYIWRAPNA